MYLGMFAKASNVYLIILFCSIRRKWYQVCTRIDYLHNLPGLCIYVIKLIRQTSSSPRKSVNTQVLGIHIRIINEICI